MPTVKYMKVNGRMIKPQDMEYIHILMEQLTRETGRMICNMDKASRNGSMDHIMREIMKMVHKVILNFKGKKHGKGIFKWID